MTYLFSGFIFIVILAILIFVHELGHFLAAKLSGVKVEEFGFGFPPRIFGKKYGETIYSINAIPAGGFVRLTGEDDNSSTADPRSFAAKKPLLRAGMLLAGVFMNVVLTLVTFSILYTIGGPIDTGKVLVTSVAKDSPAESSGLKSQDLINEIDGKKLSGPSELGLKVKQLAGSQVSLKLERGNETLVVTLIPRASPPSGEGPVGITTAPNIISKSYPFWQAPVVGSLQALKFTSAMLGGLRDLVADLFTRAQVPQDIGGVVRIGYVTHLAAQEGILAILQWVGLLSLNLAIINALPIPALDGGRLVFVLIEAATKKKVPAKFERIIHSVGLALLLLLVVIITYNDIIFLWVNTNFGKGLRELLPFF